MTPNILVRSASSTIASSFLCSEALFTNVLISSFLLLHGLPHSFGPLSGHGIHSGYSENFLVFFLTKIANCLSHVFLLYSQNEQATRDWVEGHDRATDRQPVFAIN